MKKESRSKSLKRSKSQKQAKGGKAALRKGAKAMSSQTGDRFAGASGSHKKRRRNRLPYVKVQCPACQGWFSKDVIDLHTNSQHPAAHPDRQRPKSEVPVQNEQHLLACPICRSEKPSKDLRQHYKAAHDAVECPICHLPFKRKLIAEHHLLEHANRKEVRELFSEQAHRRKPRLGRLYEYTENWDGRYRRILQGGGCGGK